MPRQLIGIRVAWVPSLTVYLERLTHIKGGLLDMRPLFERIVRGPTKRCITRHFRESGVDGVPYPPLAKATIMQKWTNEYYNKPLLRSGRWFFNATSRKIWAITKHSANIVPARVRWYGWHVHEQGKTGTGVGHKGTIPRRAVLVWDRQFAIDLMKETNEYLQELVEGR